MKWESSYSMGYSVTYNYTLQLRIEGIEMRKRDE